MLFNLVPAIQPRMLMTFETDANDELKQINVPVRVGQVSFLGYSCDSHVTTVDFRLLMSLDKLENLKLSRDSRLIPLLCCWDMSKEPNWPLKNVSSRDKCYTNG